MTKNELRSLLADGNANQVLTELKSLTVDIPDLHNDVVLISAQLAENDRQKRLNIAPPEVIRIEQNRINSVIIIIIDKIPDDELRKKKDKKLEKIALWFGIFAAIAAITGITIREIIINNTQQTDLSNSEPLKEILEKDGKLSAPDAFETKQHKEKIEERPGISIMSIKIGEAIWSAKNIDIEVKNSWCYDHIPFNCVKFGRLYTWEAAKNACRKYGEGWRLPTKGEWAEMARGYTDSDKNHEDIGNPKEAYERLNNYGFGNINGGRRDPNGSFHELNNYGYFWVDQIYSDSRAYFFYFHKVNRMVMQGDQDKAVGYSCRCIKEP